MEIKLSEARITGCGIGYAGDGMLVSIHFVAPIGLEGVSQLGEGLRRILYYEGNGDAPPRLNPFNAVDAGISVPQTCLDFVRFPGGPDEQLTGKISSFDFSEKGGTLLVEIKFTTDADALVFEMLLNQKKDPFESFVVSGEVKGGEFQQQLPLSAEEPPTAVTTRGRKGKTQ